MKKWTVDDVMTSKVISVPAEMPYRSLVDTLVANRVSAVPVVDDFQRLPVIDDLGRLIGVVSRGDLLKVHLRPDDEILADVREGVLRAFLADEAATIETRVASGVVTLTGKVSRWSTTDIADRLVRQIPGVAEVINHFTFDFDDRNMGTGLAFGIA